MTYLANSLKLSGAIEGGFCWDELTRERMRDPKALENYGYKVYSQNDEDGIIHEIFKRIGTTSKKFIEFGVQNGLECNSHLLLFYGWQGLWIEGADKYYSEICMKFRPVIDNGQLQIMNAFVTRENINELIEKYTGGGYKEIDLLSIDIDGNDLYIWESISAVSPRVVVIEYNGKLPPDLIWKQAYNKIHLWNGTDWHGASLKALEELGRKKGYVLVGTNLNGCNAFLVRRDVSKDLFLEPATSEMMYNPLRLGLRFVANHPAKYCLVAQKDNLGILNYQSYELVSGFHAEEFVNDVIHVWTSATESRMRLLVAEGADKVVLSYSLPQEILALNKDYEVIIYIKDREVFKQNIREAFGRWEILEISELAEDSVLDLYLKTSFTWRPCDIMGTSDSRDLGIDIVLTGIQFE